MSKKIAVLVIVAQFKDVVLIVVPVELPPREVVACLQDGVCAAGVGFILGVEFPVGNFGADGDGDRGEKGFLCDKKLELVGEGSKGEGRVGLRRGGRGCGGAGADGGSFAVFPA